MKELDIQDKYLINFLCERPDGLHYNEVKPNTVSSKLFIVEDLKEFLSNTDENKESYRKLLRKFKNEDELMDTFMDFLSERINSSMNMAIFINNNKTVTFEGQTLHLFYPSGSEIHEDTLFEQNIFSVVQELPYSYKHKGKQLFSFRPDVSFFLNGIFFAYSELKSNYNNQNARKNGRNKVKKDYHKAVRAYLSIAKDNDLDKSLRKASLKIFEKAIHITSTDIYDTYIIRNISLLSDDIKEAELKGNLHFDSYENKFLKAFKPYPLLKQHSNKTERLEEVFRALYDKRMIEKEILYYNFIERDLIKKARKKRKEYKHNDGRLISPRPKQKFGADKILGKIDEFLEHENEPDYFINKLKKQLESHGVGKKQANELIAKRLKFQNNKNVYSLLMQYAAGFGKSNIIGWSALQLKDLRKKGEYIFDKIMLVVDRLQLRDQLDSKMYNMNISNKMFIEASDKKTFIEALSSNTRVVVVNLQKFNTIKDVLAPEVIKKLASLRIAFIIDEIHRSNTGLQHNEMISLFDELQANFDNNKEYLKHKKKKNLIIGFTATPSKHSLARFGEFSKYAENRPIWLPFDSYTMKEAIEDGYILNPIKGIVPVSTKMFFDIPDSNIEGFEADHGYSYIPDNTSTGINEKGEKYAIRKKKIYENDDRIKAISIFIAKRLVSSIFLTIRGTGKAMLAVSSIKAAIKYKGYIDKYYAEITNQRKYARFAEAPIFIAYSEGQEHKSPASLNGGLSEEKVLQNFANKKNGLIIVVDKFQTGFDEPKLHTLFLDKEISGINAIQTISRVNRTTKYKHDCKIVDFSYKNINVSNIKKAFEHFAHVVPSDFDPFKDEAVLKTLYPELKDEALYKTHFEDFVQLHKKTTDITGLLEIENAFADFIHSKKKEAKKLKKKVNQYFRILNLIEFVIELSDKYSHENFLEFWKRYNNEYNNIHRPTDIVDDVQVYFDNKIGITVPEEKQDSDKKREKKKEGDDKQRKFKYDILKVIEKRNLEEKKIEELIIQFEKKIDTFFEYIKSQDEGKRLIAKMKADFTAFEQDEIYSDFGKIYRKFIRRNKDIGDFFIKETKGIVNQLCDDFEKEIVNTYNISNEISNMAAEPKEDYKTKNE
jgi:type I restriction enzyme, R subunit